MLGSGMLSTSTGCRLQRHVLEEVVVELVPASAGCCCVSVVGASESEVGGFGAAKRRTMQDSVTNELSKHVP